MGAVNTLDITNPSRIAYSDIDGLNIGFELTQDILKGNEVSLLSTGKIQRNVSGAGFPLGVLSVGGLTGETKSVLVNGKAILLVNANAAITAGNLLMCGAVDGDGNVGYVAATTGNYATAIALESALISTKFKALSLFNPVKI